MAHVCPKLHFACQVAGSYFALYSAHRVIWAFAPFGYAHRVLFHVAVNYAAVKRVFIVQGIVSIAFNCFAGGIGLVYLYNQPPPVFAYAVCGRLASWFRVVYVKSSFLFDQFRIAREVGADHSRILRSPYFDNPSSPVPVWPPHWFWYRLSASRWHSRRCCRWSLSSPHHQCCWLYCAALRARTNSGALVVSKPLKPVMVVSVISMPLLVTTKSSPLWIKPGAQSINIWLPFSGLISAITFQRSPSI